MTGSRGLSAVRDFFVAPAGSASRAGIAARAPARSLVVIGDGRDAAVVGCVVALTLAGGRGCALVCEWPPVTSAPRFPATLGARRLASRLEGRGVRAIASGRLARTALADDPAEAVGAAQRAVVAAAGAPSVVVIGRPRTEEVDALLVLHAAVVIASSPGAEPTLVRVAVEGLSDLPVPVLTLGAPAAAAARAASLSGLACWGVSSRALAPVVQAVGG